MLVVYFSRLVYDLSNSIDNRFNDDLKKVKIKCKASIENSGGTDPDTYGKAKDMWPYFSLAFYFYLVPCSYNLTPFLIPCL